MKKITFLLILTSILSVSFLTSCGIYKKTDARKTPVDALERAKVNIKEGKGMSIKNATEGFRSGGKFEFSSSNPLWRATIETLDFLPFTTVDYSGGIIITDWYNEKDSNDYLKITVRFLTNEIASDSLKIIIHKKTCKSIDNCNIRIIKSKIHEELTKKILAQAILLDQTKKK